MLKNYLRAKLFGIIALAVILVSALSFAGCGSSSNDAAPLGTAANPYLISTDVALAALATRVNSGTEPAGMYYKLTGDIDLSAYSAGAGWTPIGNGSNPFEGNFDGNGKTVSNLVIDDAVLSDAGLFGVISGGTVKNLGVEDADITGGSEIGGVAGYVNNGSSVSNCYVTGEVSGNNWVGGVAGYVNNGSSISNCYTTGEVSGNNNVGGVVGTVNNGSSVSNCYTTGEVSGNDGVGGIAGLLDGSGSVSNCYATGEVSGNNNSGGIVGYVGDGSITDCAALNPEIVRLGGGSSSFGRVAGYFFSGTLNNNAAFYDIKMGTTGVAPSDAHDGIHGDSDGGNYDEATVTAQDFYDTDPLTWGFGANLWKWVGGAYPLPVLDWQTGAQIPASLPLHLQ